MRARAWAWHGRLVLGGLTLAAICAASTDATALASGFSVDQVASVSGTWGSFRHPPSAHSAVYDPVRNRLVVFGGTSAIGTTNDVWVLTLSGTPAWTKLTPSGTPPSARSDHSAIYDPVRDRMIVYGGNGAGAANQVWELTFSSTPTWNQLAPTGTTPSRYGHSAVYDPVADRMLVFGGNDGSFNLRNEVFALSLAGTPAWTQLTPPAPQPSGRSDHTAIFDPVRDRMVVYGGNSGSTEVWSLKLAGSPTWTQLSPSGTAPPGRYGHGAVYDPVGDRMIVFGGFGSPLLGDTWSLSLASPAWTALAPSGVAPSPRTQLSATYDSQAGRMIVLGGGYETYAFGLALTGSPAWSQVGPGADFPQEHSDHSAVWDVAGGRMIVFGGVAGGGFMQSPVNETWQLSLGTEPAWTRLAPSGAPPSVRSGHSAILDPLRHRMIVFGGVGASYLNDVWALSLPGLVWTPLATQGSPPSARYGHRAVYDPARDRMLVFGGYGGSYLGDVWALSLSGTPTWTQLTPSGTPPSPRYSPGVIYDPVRDRMIVFGGGSASGYLNDLWQLSLAATPTWAPLGASGGPPTVRTTAALYDPVRDRMVCFGGHTDFPTRHLGDTWSLALAGAPAWQQLSPAGSAPSARGGNSLVYDRVRDRAVLFGGLNGGLDSFALGDTRFLQWDNPATGPAIDVAPMVLDYGQTFLGAMPTKTVLVSNLGISSLAVSNLSSNDATVTASPTSFALAPGETQSVTVRWTPVVAGGMNATLTVSSDDPDHPTRLVTATGTAVAGPSVTVAPESLHVTLAMNQSTTRTLRLTNVGGADVVFTATAIDSVPPAPAAADATQGTLDGGIAPRRSLGPLRAGGPDAFGYTFADSDEPGGPAFGWLDIRSAGTQIPTGGDDDNVGPFPIGFTFPFYGTDFTSFRLCTNGWISFTNSTLTAYTNTGLPNSGPLVPENLLAPFWDDLDFAGTPHAYYRFDGTRLVIQFQDVCRLGEPGKTNTFEVVLRPDGSIQYQYLAMTATDLTSATVGIQNAARDDGLQVAFDAPYLHDGLAVRFERPQPRFLTVAPPGGTIAPGTHTDLTVTFDAGLRPNGEYPGVVRIQSNDPLAPYRDVPCRLTVATPTAVQDDAAPVDRFALRATGANPARDRVGLELAVPRPGDVAVTVFDLRGGMVRQVARRTFDAGRHAIAWDGMDAAGHRARSGIYFIQAVGPEGRLGLRVALVR